ncbi:Lrp/AsnC family transcriptional regulator [Pelagibius sp. Alg239-R121]|uniref:Lrp/AsnC family transcriptional regulator n=1 Tax=Pelagibius sp. Alg239-R121 TaxID=2993448 RepID=UPI0024A74058|nr:Lrp/AsnC family transcriptional regulator [Pelagibius sp. Alg239-R121]
MDRIDRKILNLLQADASIRNNDLADRVGLAPSSCLRRVRQLKDAGVITKTIVLTDPEQLGRGIKAIVTLKLADHGLEARRDWLQQVVEEPTVSQFYGVSGETDMVAILKVGSMKVFQEVSKRLFASDPNVVQYVSLFVLEEHKFDLAN